MMIEEFDEYVIDIEKISLITRQYISGKPDGFRVLINNGEILLKEKNYSRIIDLWKASKLPEVNSFHKECASKQLASI